MRQHSRMLRLRASFTRASILSCGTYSLQVANACETYAKDPIPHLQHLQELIIIFLQRTPTFKGDFSIVFPGKRRFKQRNAVVVVDDDDDDGDGVVVVVDDDDGDGGGGGGGIFLFCFCQSWF